MRYRFTIAFIFFICAIYKAAGQQLSFIKYTVQDGLVANPVRCIYQDHKGFIWIGTYEGLSRYDGYRFTNYSTTNGLSHNFVNSLFEVNDKLLIAENNGAIDVIRNSTIQKGYKLTSAVNSFYAYKGRLLFSTDTSGIHEYKDDKVSRIAQEKTGHSLGSFAALNDSLLLMDGVDNNLVVFTNEFKIFALLRNLKTTFNALMVDSQKRPWLCTSNGLKLLSLPDLQTSKISFASLPPDFDIDPLRTSQVTAITEEPDGSFWIGTDKGLFHLFDKNNYQVFTEKDGLPSSAISTIYRDRENNLWIGTALGLAKWVANNNVSFFNAERKDFKNDIYSIHLLKEQKYLLNTQHGLQLFDFRSKEFTDLKKNKEPPQIIIDNSSPIMTFAGKTIGVFNDVSHTISPLIQLDTLVPEVYGACKTNSGKIFLASGKGLFAVVNGTAKQILPFRITCLLDDKQGNLWAGSWLNGLHRIKINNDPSAENFETKDFTSLIEQKEIRELFLDSHKNVWVGTRYGGAWCLVPKESDSYSAIQFNRRKGLMSDWIRSFGETSSGDIWIGTYLGLDRLVKLPNGYRVFNFSKATNFFAQVDQIMPAGNDQWICVANLGIAYFTDKQLHTTTPLQASILTVSLGTGDHKLSLISPAEKIFLKPYQNTARFDFSALGFANEKQILYSYRLKGSSDTTWSNPENIHEASYASLSPGNYTFEVRTLGWNGELGQPASFSFVIATPFWKQWWFMALCFLVVAALVYALYRYRIRQIMQIQKVRNSIATDLHDDIGSALTNISILAELSSKKNQQQSFAENLPSKISEESALAQQALDDIIWSVNSKNDTLNQTTARMRRYAAEILEPIGINCEIDFSDVPVDYKLNMEQRKDIYLVFKECLNNIIKHAGARNVEIKISLVRNIFILNMKDDGKGFEHPLLTERNGLKNIQSRVRRWEGKIDIDSKPGIGTAIHCEFPLASPK